MQLGRIGMKRPEDFPKLFHVYGQETTTSSATGRIRMETPMKKAELRCILSIAKPEEVERFKQNKVVVTHTIFHAGEPQAKENDVPIHEDEKLAGTLSKLDIGEYIPPELYEVVAEILVFVDNMEKIRSKLK